MIIPVLKCEIISKEEVRREGQSLHSKPQVRTPKSNSSVLSNFSLDKTFVVVVFSTNCTAIKSAFFSF